MSINSTIKGIPASCWGIEPTDKGFRVNSQLLIEQYLRKRPTVYDIRGAFYEYRNGVWLEKQELKIKKLLRRIVNIFVPYVWNTSVSNAVSKHLPEICFSFDRLRPATNFINLKNGLLDLETFELRPHNKIYASLVQLPFDYDPEAECPRFHKFLRTCLVSLKVMI